MLPITPAPFLNTGMGYVWAYAEPDWAFKEWENVLTSNCKTSTGKLVKVIRALESA